MATAAVIGEALAIEGYALAGAATYPAHNPEEACAAFDALPSGTALVIMTGSAARWLGSRLDDRPGLLTAVLRS